MLRDYCKDICKDIFHDCEYLCNRAKNNYPIDWQVKCKVAVLYDVYNIVHCHDCKYSRVIKGHYLCRRELMSSRKEENAFCSYGELLK